MRHALPGMWRRGLYEAIARRRDVRHFREGSIPSDVLARILGAAHQAGSVGFSQPWDFIIIEDRALREEIRTHVEAERIRGAERFEDEERRKQYLSFKLEGILESALNVCVTCDRTRFGPAVLGRNTIPETDLYSTVCAVQNLWLAARAEGVGVGWVSILEPPELRRLLGIPDHVVPVAYLCLGDVESFPERPTLETAQWLPKLQLSRIVHSGKWGEPPAADLAAAIANATSPAENVDDGKRAERHGWLIVYTGNGKGKTTAALGAVFRALGRELPVAVVQFIKGKWKTGERLFAEQLPGLEFHVMGRGFTWESDDISQDKQAAIAAWETAKGFIRKGDHALVVLDELTYALNYGFVSLEDALATFESRPAHVNVIVTGRNAPDGLVALADLVTEMKSVKHPFDRGVKAQPGIDF